MPTRISGNEVYTIVRPFLSPSNQQLRLALEWAMNMTIMSVSAYIRDPSSSPVPVYDPRYYKYPRKKGKTYQLLLSGRVIQTARGFGIKLSWETPYAKYLIQKGRRGVAHARPYGGHRTLLWPGVVARRATWIFLQNLRHSAARFGIKWKRIPRRRHN